MAHSSIVDQTITMAATAILNFENVNIPGLQCLIGDLGTARVATGFFQETFAATINFTTLPKNTRRLPAYMYSIALATNTPLVSFVRPKTTDIVQTGSWYLDILFQHLVKCLIFILFDYFYTYIYTFMHIYLHIECT